MSTEHLGRKLAERCTPPLLLFPVPGGEEFAWQVAEQRRIIDSHRLPASACPVTERQLWLAAAIAEGVPTGVLARRQGVAEATIRSALREACRRAGQPNRPALVAALLRTGHLRWAGGRVVADRTPPPRLFWLAGRPMPVEQAAERATAQPARKVGAA